MSRNKTPPPEIDSEHDELAFEFGPRVRALRDRSEMTLEDLATRSGVSRAMLSKVERGEKESNYWHREADSARTGHDAEFPDGRARGSTGGRCRSPQSAPRLSRQ